ncbi:hypothetical protein E2L08_15605 [Palleronia sediminis]|uniref:HNH domain-containing protein n=1 Tax=Palleronia sediminis TaxID=2547833 RepID=A0A4R5ZXC0_9RHOB|nr:HNH endonuclease [Palleronia sediminis]TDL74915.1 hypothetical protein E2L08_15605 [Palleronia sediminis]
MPIIVVSVAWMPEYRHHTEPAYSNDAWHQNNEAGGESLNFLNQDGRFYGYVRVDGNLAFKGHPEQFDVDGDGIGRADIVFVGPNPQSGTLFVVGFYRNAKVLTVSGQDPSGRDGIHFITEDAVLIPENERVFFIPSAQRRDDGYPYGVGQSRVWYALTLDDNTIELRNDLIEYMANPMDGDPSINELNSNDEEVKRLSAHRRFERRGNYGAIKAGKGNQCECCGWEAKKGTVWTAALELHHKKPLAQLQPNKPRRLVSEDFALLCARCHRAIHSFGFPEDIARFKAEHLH